MAAELQKRLDYLIHNLKAYEGYNHRGQGLRNAVKTQLNWWAKVQQDMDIIRNGSSFLSHTQVHFLAFTVPFLFEDLWKAACTGNYKQYIAQVTDQDWQQFPILESNDRYLRIEDKRGILTHNSVDIEGGARSMLDCFMHQAPLIWKDRKHQELTGLGRKGKGKQETPDSMDDIGNTKSEDLDTDEELGVMYTLRLGEMEGEDSD
ncbi:MAG: hypothetical protein M1839_004104 [Geoglossum umbratile]|nr:MAG: hypothetical protein M1839_004104 [Geoglossum umbratile]